MKQFAMVLTLALSTLFAFTASAEEPTLVMVLGGMGTDGASLQPFPKENSVEDAAAIYNALKTKAGNGGKKKVGFTFQGDVVGLECDKPNQGIHTKTAGCEYMTVIKEKRPKDGISISIGSIDLAEASSQKIFDALNIVDDSGRVGATTKAVGNLKCVRAVRPGVLAKCKLSNVTVSKMSIDMLEPKDQAALKKLAAKLGIK